MKVRDNKIAHILPAHSKPEFSAEYCEIPLQLRGWKGLFRFKSVPTPFHSTPMSGSYAPNNRRQIHFPGWRVANDYRVDSRFRGWLCPTVTSDFAKRLRGRFWRGWRMPDIKNPSTTSAFLFFTAIIISLSLQLSPRKLFLSRTFTSTKLFLYLWMPGAWERAIFVTTSKIFNHFWIGARAKWEYLA